MKKYILRFGTSIFVLVGFTSVVIAQGLTEYEQILQLFGVLVCKVSIFFGPVFTEIYIVPMIASLTGLPYDQAFQLLFTCF